MGIRYYAYAFDADMTEFAVADPRSFISDDPLADAWGIHRGAKFAVASMVQSVPKTDMLYLDKAWSSLQALSAPSWPDDPPRPAYRMFQGQVDMTDCGWIPWVRALAPDDVVEIADDLLDLQRGAPDAAAGCQDARYTLEFLQDAVEFVTHAASSNRGFVYMIG